LVRYRLERLNRTEDIDTADAQSADDDNVPFEKAGQTTLHRLVVAVPVVSGNSGLRGVAGDPKHSMKMIALPNYTSLGDTMTINALPGLTEPGYSNPILAAAPHAITVRRVAVGPGAFIGLHSATTLRNIIQPAHSIALVAHSEHAISARGIALTQHTRSIRFI